MTKAAEQEAWAIAVELHKLGIKPEGAGNWVVFRPPPPLELFMRIQRLPPGLVERLLPQVMTNDKDSSHETKHPTQ